MLAHLEALTAQAARGQEALEHLSEAHEQPAAHEADDLAGELLLPALVAETLLEQKAEGDVVGVQLEAGELALPRGAVLGGGGELGFAQLAAALAEVVQQAAVGHEVRVAADRRGEVQVRRAGEPEVPEVRRAVARLFEGAQQERAPGLPAAALASARLGDDAAEAAERLRELRRRHRLGGRERRRLHAELFERVEQLAHLGRVGRLVHAVQRARLLAQQELGHRLVGGQHELLDERVRRRLGARHRAGEGARVVERVFGLERAQREGAAGLTAAAQHARQFVRAGAAASRSSSSAAVVACGHLARRLAPRAPSSGPPSVPPRIVSTKP